MIVSVIKTDGINKETIIDSQLCEEDEENFIIPLGSDINLLKNAKKIEFLFDDNLLFSCLNPHFKIIEIEDDKELKGGVEKI